MTVDNLRPITGRRPMTPHGAVRLEAAHARYVAALRALSGLRCDPRRQPEYAGRLNEASRRVKETLSEWLMLYEHETGV